MLQVKIESSSGPALVSYTISTPNSEEADKIDPSLPTVILLHPIYVSQVIFHYQFSCPELRRFNLIAFDARLHGNTVAAVPPKYRQPQAAEDVFCFMKALKLPPCHFYGVSSGSCIALEMAVSHPESVLSLFMVSPIPLVEPELVAAGRQEIFDYWVEGQKDPDNPDEGASLDSVFGALQLGFNQSPASFVNAMVQYTFPRAVQMWSKEHFDEFYTLSVEFFIHRDPHPISSLQKIACPVHLVHCGQDIAYPIELTEEIRDRMKMAGIDVQVSAIPDAPHFGSATHPEPINKAYYAWMMSVVDGATIPPAKISVVSPYETVLVTECGLKAHEQSDSEDELLIAP